MDPNFCFGLCKPIYSNGAGSFPPQSFYFSSDQNIYPNEKTLIIYLAALAGVDLDILFSGGGGGDLLTDNYTYTHIYSINNIVSGSHLHTQNR